MRVRSFSRSARWRSTRVRLPYFWKLNELIDVLAEKIKFALNQEIREWIIHYAQSCNERYRKEMSELFKFIERIEQRLSREIKDLEDIRLVMIAVKDLREHEIQFEMQITPIEESYAMCQKYDVHIAREDIERADSLRYRWTKLQRHCVSRMNE